MEGIVNVWLAKMRTTRRIGIMVAGWVLVVQPLFMLPAHASTIQSGSVVVNELSTQPGWVELYNTTGTPVEMTNWQLQTKEQAQNLSGTLTAYGFLVFDATLSATSDTVQLFDSEATLVNTVAYGEGSSLMAPAALESIARRIDGGSVWAAGIPTKGTSNKTDFLPPSVPSGGAPNDTAETTLGFSFTWQAATDNDGPVTYEFRMATSPDSLATGFSSGVEGTSIAFQTNVDAKDGEWYWQVRAIDQSQNYSAWSDVWRVRVDTNGPGMTIAQPGESELFGGPATKGIPFQASVVGSRESEPFTLELDGADVTSQVSSVRDDQSCLHITGSFNADTLSDGAHIFRLRAIDDVGNPGEQLRTVIVDKTAPELSTSIDEGAAIGGKVRVLLMAQEVHPGDYGLTIERGGKGVPMNMTSQSEAETMTSNQPVLSYVWDTTTVEDGTYELRFRGTDAAGNEALLIRTVIVSNSVPGAGSLNAPISQSTDPLLDELSKQLTQAFIMPKSLDLAPIEVATTSDQLSSTGRSTPLILPATDQNTKLTAVAPTESGWRIFGVLWYWWLLLAMTVTFTYRRLRKTSRSPLLDGV